MGRNYVTGRDGDRINAVLACDAIGWPLRVAHPTT